MAIAKERRKAGFTRVELVVVVVIGALFVLWVVPTLLLPKRHRCYSAKINCLNNLKQVGIAYRVWATDNNDVFPAQSSNGWSDQVKKGNAGAFCWTNFAIMHVELGEAPKVLFCPADERTWAKSFVTITNNDGTISNSDFNNMTLSYFVGVGAIDTFPQSILGGDRNLCAGKQPGNGYGFSPTNGMGNDVTIATNSAANPISWTRKTHINEATESSGGGHILLGDGSAQWCSSTQLRQFQASALDSGNFASNAIPKTPSFRLVFP